MTKSIPFFFFIWWLGGGCWSGRNPDGQKHCESEWDSRAGWEWGGCL